MRSTIAIAVLVAMFAACQETPPPQPDYAPRRVVELARWQVWIGGEAVGTVRHLEIQDPREPVRYYTIEDRHRRVLGEATANGRFARRVPFQENGEDLGVWSLARGVGELFEAGASVDLRPVPVEADARRTSGRP